MKKLLPLLLLTLTLVACNTTSKKQDQSAEIFAGSINKDRLKVSSNKGNKCSGIIGNLSKTELIGILKCSKSSGGVFLLTVKGKNLSGQTEIDGKTIFFKVDGYDPASRHLFPKAYKLTHHIYSLQESGPKLKLG